MEIFVAYERVAIEVMGLWSTGMLEMILTITLILQFHHSGFLGFRIMSFKNLVS